MKNLQEKWKADGLEPKDIARLGNLYNTSSTDVLRLQAKVEEQIFRRKQADIMPKILARLAEEKAKLVATS